MTKTHVAQRNANSLGLVVYQCEMCGRWYASIATLKAHKNKCHAKHDMAMQCRLV